MLIPHYRHDIGGWLGNLYPISFLLGRRVTVCTDEAFTVLYLLESLQAHGLLREYRPERHFAVRGRKFPFHHYAAVLMDSGGTNSSSTPGSATAARAPRCSTSLTGRAARTVSADLPGRRAHRPGTPRRGSAGRSRPESVRSPAKSGL